LGGDSPRNRRKEKEVQKKAKGPLVRATSSGTGPGGGKMKKGKSIEWLTSQEIELKERWGIKSEEKKGAVHLLSHSQSKDLIPGGDNPNPSPEPTEGTCNPDGSYQKSGGQNKS